jgi:uncharacterized protein (DUF2235 family)
MKKRIVLCFDGTWNKPDPDTITDGDENTNVVRLFQSITQGTVSGGIKQEAHYVTGVGTTAATQAIGGGLGYGLSAKIIQGYQILCRTYQPGDEIFITGFSRGGFTACSLAGLVCNKGLHLGTLNDAAAGAVYLSYLKRNKPPTNNNFGRFITGIKDLTLGMLFQPAPIRFLGVWDVVGALGLSAAAGRFLFGSLGDELTSEIEHLHDTHVYPAIESAYHALAIHENRIDFAPTLWTNQPAAGQSIQQVWFPGAHSNVGGGYAERGLSDIALTWMAEKAQSCGLVIDPTKIPSLDSRNTLPDPVDSFATFAKDAYALVPGNTRHYRPMGALANGTEFIHGSVQEWLAAKAGRDLARHLEGRTLPPVAPP